MAETQYNFLMLSAMYENGGNTTHRLLDGHPEMFVYPFESQPGTKFVTDHLSSMYPLKYRWPIFPSSATAEEMYRLIIDEECRVRANTPFVSKFRDAAFDFADKDRMAAYLEFLKDKPLTRANVMEAFYRATFIAWKNVKKTGNEKFWVGYSPIIGVDGDKIIRDYGERGHVLHVVRNPFSAYGDTKKRPAPLSIDHYMLGWVTCQYYAKIFAEKYPNNFHIVKYEDEIKNPKEVLGALVQKLGLAPSDTLAEPSWNGEVLKQVFPWGTIRIPTEESNVATGRELNKEEIAEIYARTKEWITHYGYEEVYQKIAA